MEIIVQNTSDRIPDEEFYKYICCCPDSDEVLTEGICDCCKSLLHLQCVGVTSLPTNEVAVFCSNCSIRPHFVNCEILIKSSKVVSYQNIESKEVSVFGICVTNKYFRLILTNDNGSLYFESITFYEAELYEQIKRELVDSNKYEVLEKQKLESTLSKSEKKKKKFPIYQIMQFKV